MDPDRRRAGSHGWASLSGRLAHARPQDGRRVHRGQRYPFSRGTRQRFQQEHVGGRMDLEEPARHGQSLRSPWLCANYEAGDVVLHSPYTIHAATTNTDPNGIMRLSTDLRYQNVLDEIDARWSTIGRWTTCCEGIAAGDSLLFAECANAATAQPFCGKKAAAPGLRPRARCTARARNSLRPYYPASPHSLFGRRGASVD